jgi:hypothetical protein
MNCNMSAGATDEYLRNAKLNNASRGYSMTLQDLGFMMLVVSRDRAGVSDRVRYSAIWHPAI